MEKERKRIFDDVIENKFPEILRILEKNMDFNRWGFSQSFIGYGRVFPPSIIYDSNLCRVRFVWQLPDVRDRHATIYMVYGRLHAPVDKSIITKDGEECHCWHDIKLVLNFLDGLSPQDIITKRIGWPQIMEQFVQSEIGRKLSGRECQPEWIIRMHNTVWEHYGQRLFEIFDLKQPSFWDKYVEFTNEYYKIKGLIPNKVPPQNNIC